MYVGAAKPWCGAWGVKEVMPSDLGAGLHNAAQHCAENES